MVIAVVQWACMRYFNQSLHFVVFLFLWVFAPVDAAAAPEARGEIPPALDDFFFFLPTRAGEAVLRLPAAEAPLDPLLAA